MMYEYVCVDLETTGLNPKSDRIIEIGAVHVRDGEIVGTFQTFVNPRRLLEERITELTGITKEDLADAPVLDEVFDDFLEFAGELPLLGHSVLFDYSFLKKAAVDRKKTFERNGVDTLKIARKYLPELESRGLGFLCKHYGIPHQAHRALEDAKATVALYERLEEAFYQPEDGLFVASPLIFKVKRDQPMTPAQRERLSKLLETHQLTEQVDLDGLTRSEASRLTDKLLAKQIDFLYNGKLKN